MYLLDPHPALVVGLYGHNAGSPTDWRAAYRTLMDAIAGDVFTAADEAFSGGVALSDEADPYPTWNAMRAAARDDSAPFYVSRANCNHPVLTAAENYLWRVHHDAVHVLANAPAFSYTGEVEAFRATVDRLELDGPALGALCMELVGQSAWFQVYGVFPTWCKRQRISGAPVDAWTALAKHILGF